MMKGKVKNRIFGSVMAMLLCFTPVLSIQAAEKVTPTEKEYCVDLYEASGMFLSNKKAVNLTEGEEVYLTYTVSSVEKDEAKQQGVVATKQNNVDYPYNQRGCLQFTRESVLFKEGYTYFFKFDVTDEGFECVSASAKGTDEEYITFLNSAGEVMEGMKYAGIWMAEGKVTAKLNHVRCYNKNGNDLGIALNHAREGSVYIGADMQGRKNITHSYEFELKDAYNVAVSNERYSDSDVVYMEYKIESASNNFSQTGVEMTNSPLSVIPHGGDNAFLRYDHITDDSGSVLCIPGATYLIRFERTEDNFEATVKYTVNGVTKYLSFPKEAGKFSKDYGYFTLWFGEGKKCTANARFVDFKCYDKDGKNLAVQTNQNVEITHHGGLEDYSLCEAVYYCVGNDTFITLDDEKNASVHVGDAEETKEGIYFIDGSSMQLTVGDSMEEYTYYYSHMTDANGNKYIRMKENQVRFVTGETTVTETADAKNGYKVIKPDTPKLEKNTFKCWCLGDGTEYDFDQVVTKATTLYARWVDGDGNEYLAQESVETNMNFTAVAVIGVCSMLVIGTAVAGIFIMRGGKRREKH